MALTGILFWFFGFFYCLYYFCLVNMALIPITKPIFRERDSSAMYFDHGWIKKTMHCFSVTGGGGYREMQIMHSDLIRETQTELCRMHNLCEKKRNTFRLSCKNIALDNCKEQTFSKVPCGMTFSNVYTLPFNSLLLILKSV